MEKLSQNSSDNEILASKWDTLSDAKANWDSLSDSTKDQYMEKTRQLMLKHIAEEAKNKEVELIKEEAKKEEVDNRISQY